MMSNDKKNLFVIGPGDFTLPMIRRVRGPERYAFHTLLEEDEVLGRTDFDFDELLDRATDRLERFDGSIDGILTHWDFPSSTLRAVLSDRFDLRRGPLSGILMCEHKYWGRLEQRKVLPDMVPEFDKVNPFDDDALANLRLDFPFWLKPVVGFSSALGFRIDDEDDFHRALEKTRRKIHRIGDPFTQALRYADLPEEMAEVDGSWCVAEKLVSGRQSSVEGYCLHGGVHAHGCVDCYKDREFRSFNRYEYPSSWPERQRERMVEAAKKLMSHLRYDDAPFGVEFFWDPETDRMTLLEVNARISISHSDQFIKVRGVSNHEVAVKVALGEHPDLPPPGQHYRRAAKFHLRRYADAEVLRVPDEENLEKVRREIPDTVVKVQVEPGKRLSELHDQDSYSYEIAALHIGADSQKELLERFRACADLLDFEFSDGGEPEEIQFVDPVDWDEA